ncbi:hypothetical protein FQN54_001641 [Arachnomyces sp. PD_36]|nr:hypothetical protein FQN54_001641 [Arachnomyces sp. PD_36]
MEGLNAHEKPPEAIRQLYKKYQKLSLLEIDAHPDIIDLRRVDANGPLTGGLLAKGRVSADTLRGACEDFMSDHGCKFSSRDLPLADVPIFEHPAVSGQIPMPMDKTLDGGTANLPTEGSTSGRRSFFNDDPERIFTPKDPNVHKPISLQRVLDRKLRWVTLGGQYNWTDKKYPSETPPPFPRDIATLLGRLFPDTDAQAAIVNLYSPGDTLSVHRDVSEECDIGLISVSFGCDGLFMIGHDNSDSSEVIRLRSGDAVYMTGQSRFAWHGVPKIIPETCPLWLRDWPSLETDGVEGMAHWKGWMAGKRVNLNVRQMTHDELPAAKKGESRTDITTQ